MESLQIEHTRILSVEGLQSRRLCYEGCDKTLDNGIGCGLGIVARRKALGMEWRFGHRDRIGHQCKPVGQGRAMYHLVVTTSVGTFYNWDEAGKQLLRITAEELMNKTHGFSIPDQILDQVVSNKCRLIAMDTANRQGQIRTQLIQVQPEAQVDSKPDVGIIRCEPDGDVFVDALEEEVREVNLNGHCALL